MAIPAPAFIKTIHARSYPAIDPTQSGLSSAGKTVVIASSDDDEANLTDVALSFAASGASNIVLMGASANSLTHAKAKIEHKYPSINWLIVTADVTSTESIGIAAHSIRASVGAWHVFVHARLFTPTPTTLAGADTEEWWETFEKNVKFVHLFTKHFMPKARPNATYIVRLPGMTQGRGKHSAALASQSAILTLNEYLATEHPTLRVFNVAEGNKSSTAVVEGEGPPGRAEGTNGADSSADLFGNFCVWLSAPDQDFLRGRLICCDWDAGELVAQKVEIEGDQSLLRAGWHSASSERNTL